MSYATMALILFDIQENFEEDDSDRIDHPINSINTWLQSQCSDVMHLLPDEMMNGHVNPNSVWIGFFSYLDTDGMLDVIKSQNWRLKDSVEVLFKGEEDEHSSFSRLNSY